MSFFAKNLSGVSTLLFKGGFVEIKASQTIEVHESDVLSGMFDSFVNQGLVEIFQAEKSTLPEGAISVSLNLDRQPKKETIQAPVEEVVEAPVALEVLETVEDTTEVEVTEVVETVEVASEEVSATPAVQKPARKNAKKV